MNDLFILDWNIHYKRKKLFTDKTSIFVYKIINLYALDILGTLSLDMNYLKLENWPKWFCNTMANLKYLKLAMITLIDHWIVYFRETVIIER